MLPFPTFATPSKIADRVGNDRYVRINRRRNREILPCHSRGKISQAWAIEMRNVIYFFFFPTIKHFISRSLSFSSRGDEKFYGMCILFVQVQRLADYERYLGQEARSLIDSECIDSGTVLHRGQLEGDLHRIQELFPGDNLRLHERDVVTTVRRVSSYRVKIFFLSALILDDRNFSWQSRRR